MKQWKRLFYYLLLNVLVSACTVFAVLMFWDRTQSPLPGGTLGRTFNLPGPLAVASPTPTVSETQESALPNPTATPVFIVYQVKDYDTFDSIAQTYGVSVDELIAVNGFTKDQPLGAGEVLRIPVHSSASQQEAGVAIDSVLGAGDLSSERVEIRQDGEGELLLDGWTLEDEHGNVFTFPPLELSKDGFKVLIYTKAGVNSADSLYWGLDKPVWQTGETVSLRDSQGILRTTFQVP
jgi:LysM repeat protein